MTGVTADIEKCYATAAFLVAKIFELRDCLVLDYVAYRSFGVAASPYFEPKTITARWTRYGAPAQFDSQNRLARYVQNAYSLVQAYRDPRADNTASGIASVVAGRRTAGTAAVGPATHHCPIKAEAAYHASAGAP
jgi:hypothetical protein